MRRTLLLVLMLPALVACGGDSKEGSSGSDRLSDSNSSSEPAPEPSKVEVAPTPEPAAKELNNKQLKSVLPGLEDMPAGFSASTAESDESDDDPLCGVDVSADDERNANASTDYSAQEGLSAQEMSFGISQFDSPEDATAFFDEAVAQLRKCRSFDMDGDTVTVSPMSAGKIGAKTAAFKMTATSDGFDVSINLILTATGPSTIGSFSASVGLVGSTVAELVRLTKQTVQKYEHAAGLP